MPKQNISAVISGMGVGMSILTTLVEKARRKGLSNEDIHRLTTPEGELLLEQFVEIMAKAKEPVSAQQVFPVMFQGQILEQMITGGRYDWVDLNINSQNFPAKMPEGGEVKLVIVHFNRFIGSEAVIAEFGKMDLRPAELPDLLAFGKDYPEEQRKYPIIALGSVWQTPLGDRLVPELWDRSGRRDLYLHWFEHVWSPRCRFLAARK